MKLSPRDAAGYFARPDPNRAGLLIYGPEAMRVALRRQQVLKALLGAEAAEEMRLTRMAGSDLRRNPGEFLDAVKARGFFPGPRAVFVEEVGDAATAAITTALAEWQQGDAVIVVTAGQLAARSSLRKLFESHANTYAAAIYAEPPGRAEIEATLARAGIKEVGAAAMTDLVDLSKVIDPGDFAQTMEKLSLYKYGDTTPISSEDVAVCAPATTEAGLDDAIHVIAEGRQAEVGPLMHKLAGQGIAATTICIGATRHFRALHMAASHPKGPEAGLSATRPPVFGPRRDRMVRQARAIGMHKLEAVIAILIDTDLGLRSAQEVPARAFLERAFIRIAMLAKT